MLVIVVPPGAVTDEHRHLLESYRTPYTLSTSAREAMESLSSARPMDLLIFTGDEGSAQKIRRTLDRKKVKYELRHMSGQDLADFLRQRR